MNVYFPFEREREMGGSTQLHDIRRESVCGAGGFFTWYKILMEISTDFTSFKTNLQGGNYLLTGVYKPVQRAVIVQRNKMIPPKNQRKRIWKKQSCQKLRGINTNSYLFNFAKAGVSVYIFKVDP